MAGVGDRAAKDALYAGFAEVAKAFHHLRAMAGAGILTTRRDGTRIFYALAGDRVGELWSALQDVAATHVAGLEKLAAAYLGERGEVVVLDVRPAAEYTAGHIAGARSLPVGALRRQLRSLPKDADVVAYCR